MKHSLLTLVITFCSFYAFAQDAKEESETAPGGFRKEMLFTGGNINISFYNGGFTLGATPQLGYSVTNWLDAGISFGFTYSKQTQYDLAFNTNFRVKQTDIAPGVFARLFPFEGLFVNAQYEHNFVSQKISYDGLEGSDRVSKNVGSLLLGLGYANGKQGRNSPYYFLSLSFDVLNKPFSPYTDINGDIYPILNAGFNIPLFQGSSRR